MDKQIIIHKEISFQLFANLDKVINKSKLSELTGYNYRTIDNHLKMMSENYKERQKYEASASNGK